MRLLLLGKDGQVGQALRLRLEDQCELVACGHADVDFERPHTLTQLIKTVRPDFIVNAVAYTAVDRAEGDAGRARMINSRAVATLAAAANDCWLIHFSTDFVFDGRKKEPYIETDDAAPLNVYGATKLEGDRAIISSGCKHLIFRVSWIYGLGHNNFPTTVLQLGKERASLEVVADQIGAPTSASLVAEITTEAIARIAETAGETASRLSGVYNLSPSGAVSRADLARYIIAEAIKRRARLMILPEGIIPIATMDFSSPAARPLNSQLNTKKLQNTFGMHLPPWQQDTQAFIDGMVEGNLI
jgi:dTDP-4-dehydrorhamnose reductase